MTGRAGGPAIYQVKGRVGRRGLRLQILLLDGWASGADPTRIQSGARVRARFCLWGLMRKSSFSAFLILNKSRCAGQKNTEEDGLTT